MTPGETQRATTAALEARLEAITTEQAELEFGLDGLPERSQLARRVQSALTALEAEAFRLERELEARRFDAHQLEHGGHPSQPPCGTTDPDTDWSCVWDNANLGCPDGI